jgi:hypothetical protein
MNINHQVTSVIFGIIRDAFTFLVNDGSRVLNRGYNN